MKLIKKIVALFLCSFLVVPTLSVNAQTDKIEDGNQPTNDTYKVSFDLTNPDEQKAVLYDPNGNPITITMSEELSPQTRYTDYLPNGSFKRKFAATNQAFTMSAQFDGICNPYLTKVNLVHSGKFTGVVTFIRDRYGKGYLANHPNVGFGVYQVDYTMPAGVGGTYFANLEVAFYPGQHHARAECRITFNNY